MIPLAAPNLGRREAEYAASAIASGWVGPDGPFVERFEDLVAKASGRKWAVATITGTAALHVAGYVLGFSGKRVAFPEEAFPAARNVLTMLGCDISEIYTGSDHDLWWYSYDADQAHAFCDRAPAIGEPPTTVSKSALECYSFAANKIATCGHGGAVVGDDPDLLTGVRLEVRQGYYLDGHFNYRMANINAAIGCAQMERLDELKDAKRRIWQRYADAGLPMVDRGPSRWMATLRAPAGLVETLARDGIESRAEPAGVSIPCGTGLTEYEQDNVIKSCATLLS
jgi:perosamine synthetase